MLTLYRLPWGLLAALVLAAGVERFVASNTLDFTRPDLWEWRLSRRAAGREAKGAVVLALGSSVVKQGIVPRAIEAADGLPAFNLAVCAGSPISSYYLLRKAVESGARPSAVVVEFHVGMLTESHWLTSEFWPELLDARAALDLAREAGDPRFFASIMAARLLPTVKDRRMLRASVLASLRGESASEALGVLAMRRNHRVNRGAKLAPRRFGDQQGPLPVEPTLWACAPLNDRYVGRFLDLAASRGIKVLWLLPPARADFQTRREADGIDLAYRTYARGRLARHPHLTLVDATRAGFPDDLFIDAQHLNRDGALVLTSRLNSTLAQVASGMLQAGSWVPLGTEEPTAAVAAEDMGESSRAVRKLRVR